jgi:hypothetical protein
MTRRGGAVRALTDHVETRAIERYTQQAAAARDRLIREEIDTTDWDEYAVLDIVFVREGATMTALSRDPLSDGFTIRENYTVRRWRDAAPPVEEVAVPGYDCEVLRVTEPLWKRVQSTSRD